MKGILPPLWMNPVLLPVQRFERFEIPVLVLVGLMDLNREKEASTFVAAVFAMLFHLASQRSLCTLAQLPNSADSKAAASEAKKSALAANISTNAVIVM